MQRLALGVMAALIGVALISQGQHSAAGGLGGNTELDTITLNHVQS